MGTRGHWLAYQGGARRSQGQGHPRGRAGFARPCRKSSNSRTPDARHDLPGDSRPPQCRVRSVAGRGSGLVPQQRAELGKKSVITAPAQALLPTADDSSLWTCLPMPPRGYAADVVSSLGNDFELPFSASRSHVRRNSSMDIRLGMSRSATALAMTLSRPSSS